MKVTPEGYLTVVFTNSAPSPTDPGWPRNNLTFAVSYDNGETWKDYRTIITHTDPEYYVMHPTITFLDDNILVSYLKKTPFDPTVYTDIGLKTVLYKRNELIKGP